MNLRVNLKSYSLNYTISVIFLLIFLKSFVTYVYLQKFILFLKHIYGFLYSKN